MDASLHWILWVKVIQYQWRHVLSGTCINTHETTVEARNGPYGIVVSILSHQLNVVGIGCDFGYHFVHYIDCGLRSHCICGSLKKYELTFLCALCKLIRPFLKLTAPLDSWHKDPITNIPTITSDTLLAPNKESVQEQTHVIPFHHMV